MKKWTDERKKRVKNELMKEWKKKKKEKPTNNYKMKVKVKVSDRLATLEERTIKEAK